MCSKPYTNYEQRRIQKIQKAVLYIFLRRISIQIIQNVKENGVAAVPTANPSPKSAHDGDSREKINFGFSSQFYSNF